MQTTKQDYWQQLQPPPRKDVSKRETNTHQQTRKYLTVIPLESPVTSTIRRPAFCDNNARHWWSGEKHGR